MKNILLVSSVPALDAYSIGIISAALSSQEITCYAFIFLEGADQHTEEQQFARYGILPQHRGRVKFVKLAKNKLIRIFSGWVYMNMVKVFAAQHRVSIIHFISQDVMLYDHLSKFKDYDLYYTVHDLEPHPVRLSIIQQIKHYYFRIRKDKLLVKKINNLVTNSNHQAEKLQQLYPGKRIFKHQMPGNVTPSVKMGSLKVAEVKNISNYVLFFGRIEMYKGTDQLYEAFLNDPDLANIPLVIAGRGEIYFNRYKAKENNITFINRYIKDEEVGDLFKKAAVFVLPYRSATQSAVTSLAYHYHLPIVGSNIEGLKDTIIPGKTGLLYDDTEPEALSKSILSLLNNAQLKSEIKNHLKNGYDMYDKKELQIQINRIYVDQI
jgi:glycosyltransferase involved in cell wall biosynthesis